MFRRRLVFWILTVCLLAVAIPAMGERALASGGDDYEVVCTVRPEAATALGLTVIGSMSDGTGIRVAVDGGEIAPGPGGWKHAL